jgi:TIR domain
MKVFISWSGSRSTAVAEALRDWLPEVMQAVNPWVSSEDMRKGTRWSLRLAEELESTHVGVICLTPENLTASWLLFEAGALSKLHKDALVCTSLVGVDYSAVTGPLADFQHTPATKEDTHQMVKSINAAIEEGQGRLTDTHLDRAFKRCWSELQRCLETLPDPQEATLPPRKPEDMLSEVLGIVRDLASSLSPLTDPGYAPTGPGGRRLGIPFDTPLSVEEALALTELRYPGATGEAIRIAVAEELARLIGASTSQPKPPSTSKPKRPRRQ